MRYPWGLLLIKFVGSLIASFACASFVWQAATSLKTDEALPFGRLWTGLLAIALWVGLMAMIWLLDPLLAWWRARR